MSSKLRESNNVGFIGNSREVVLYASIVCPVNLNANLNNDL